MGPGNDGSFSHSEKTMLPVPPPLPVHLNTRSYQRGLSTSGSKGRGHCCSSDSINDPMDRLFDEAYRADVSILTDDGGVIYAHACILGNASPVLRSMLKQKGRTRGRRLRSISIRGVQPEAARVFVRFLYSSCYEEGKMKEFAMPLLVLSHAYVVPHLKKICESWLEQRLLSIENAIDVFQLSLLCDAPRLSLICHRFILKNFKSVSATEGWNAMKESHPVLEKELLTSIIDEDFTQKERTRKANERKVYEQLYDSMEALVHICKDGCRTIGPLNKNLRHDCQPCEYMACKGLETLVFYVKNARVPYYIHRHGRRPAEVSVQEMVDRIEGHSHGHAMVKKTAEQDGDAPEKNDVSMEEASKMMAAETEQGAGSSRAGKARCSMPTPPSLEERYTPPHRREETGFQRIPTIVRGYENGNPKPHLHQLYNVNNPVNQPGLYEEGIGFLAGNTGVNAEN
ncbi:BTB/POZ and TAZ domain-containing protein 4 [Dorcoceras hygrometricum]|uniref:BTB/POZ and TAZ domain-containing protein 4 n=1 Tax=Dorcoceras hygrometricum TaxID=472368 RepID=A0A2Z7AT90_9LAMI|nr:BTB/POZ and TAZ domain-containing protein 4 [Dorcoceras hygrometricum]